jgi:hypothetical protein
MCCSFCGSNTHTRSTCPKLARIQGTSRRYCRFCGSHDHSYEYCPRRRTREGIRARELQRQRDVGEFDGIDLHD